MAAINIRELPRTIAMIIFMVVVMLFILWFGFSGHESNPNGDPTVSQTPQVSVIESPVPGEWSVLVSSADPSSVAIQTFQRGKLIRSGTGTVVSSDGLVVTVMDVVPYASPAASYQMTVYDRVMRARVVARDVKTNLALLKTDTSDLTIAPLSHSHPPVGSPLAMVGGFVNLSVYQTFFAHAWLSYNISGYSVLDVVPMPIMSGARVLSLDGRQVGMVFIRNGQVRMVKTGQIQEFLDIYLSSISPSQ